MQTINPYIAGNPIKDKDGFVGRDNIFRDVMQMLRHPGESAIVLFGQRRIGKTTVLLQLAQRLSAEGQLTPVYFDLQDKASSSLASVLYELAQSIAAKIGQPLPNRDQFDAEGHYFRDSFLPTVATQSGPEGLVLLLDEFDVLDTLQQSQAGQSFFPYLRAWMADIQRVKFVFVIGRRPEELSIETLSTFKGVRAARVSLLGRPEVEAIVRRSEGNGSLAWSAEAVEKVWDWTQGHTYFTQLLCNIVWEEIHDDVHRSQPLQATPEDVERAVSEALKQGANAFHWIWDGLPPAERVVIAAMAEASDTVISQERIEEILNRSGVRLVVRELKLAPDILIEWELLDRVGDSGSQTFRFAVPLLRRWVKANRPLSRVKEELDRLDPLAESLFRTGQSFYSLGQVDEAERQIRQAIRVNPNHLKSRLLLGRILLESGSDKRVTESVEVLEAAYGYDPASALPDLIKTLLALADMQADDDRQLKLYDRILQLQPGQPAALERQKAVWKTRGEDALKRGELEEALNAFQNSGEELQALRVRQLMARTLLIPLLESARQHESRNDWEQAISLYRSLLKQYPDDQELLERMKTAHNQAKAFQLETARQGERRNEWMQAVSLYQTLTQQYPTDEEVLERLKSAQAQARVFQLEVAGQSEARDDWSQAIAIYNDVIALFPHDQELAGLLNAAQAHGNLLQLYADATHAIDSDDKPKAKRLLAQVLTQDPDYKDAAALLYQTVNPPPVSIRHSPVLMWLLKAGNFILSFLFSALVWVTLTAFMLSVGYSNQDSLERVLLAGECCIDSNVAFLSPILPAIATGIVIWLRAPVYLSGASLTIRQILKRLLKEVGITIVIYIAAVFFLAFLIARSGYSYTNTNKTALATALVSTFFAIVPAIGASGILIWFRTLIYHSGKRG